MEMKESRDAAEEQKQAPICHLKDNNASKKQIGKLYEIGDAAYKKTTEEALRERIRLGKNKKYKEFLKVPLCLHQNKKTSRRIIEGLTLFFFLQLFSAVFYGVWNQLTWILFNNTFLLLIHPFFFL